MARVFNGWAFNTIRGGICGALPGICAAYLGFFLTQFAIQIPLSFSANQTNQFLI